MKKRRPYDKPRTGVPTQRTSGGGAHQDARSLRRRSPRAAGRAAYESFREEGQ